LLSFLLLLLSNEQSYVQGLFSLSVSCDSTLPILPGLTWLSYQLIDLNGSICVFSEPFNLSNGTVITMTSAGATMIFQNTSTITCSGTYTIQASTTWAGIVIEADGPILFENGTIVGATSAALTIKSSETSSLQVNNFQFSDNAIAIQSNVPLASISVKNSNFILQSSQAVMFLNYSSASSTNITFTGNNVQIPSSSSIPALSINNLNASSLNFAGNSITGAFATNIQMSSSTAMFSNNNISGTGSAAPFNISVSSCSENSMVDIQFIGNIITNLSTLIAISSQSSENCSFILQDNSISNIQASNTPVTINAPGSVLLNNNMWENVKLGTAFFAIDSISNFTLQQETFKAVVPISGASPTFVGGINGLNAIRIMNSQFINVNGLTDLITSAVEVASQITYSSSAIIAGNLTVNPNATVFLGENVSLIFVQPLMAVGTFSAPVIFNGQGFSLVFRSGLASDSILSNVQLVSMGSKNLNSLIQVELDSGYIHFDNVSVFTEAQSTGYRCSAPGNALASFQTLSQVCSLLTCFGISNASLVCNSVGSCVEMDICDCNIGYTGYECQLSICFNVNGSDPNVCSGHGNCSDPDNCICNSGYDGLECASLIDSNVANACNCSQNAYCAVGACFCYLGFSGPNCETSDVTLSTSTSNPNCSTVIVDAKLSALGANINLSLVTFSWSSPYSNLNSFVSGLTINSISIPTNLLPINETSTISVLYTRACCYQNLL
jgi:hypothetical protein